MNFLSDLHRSIFDSGFHKDAVKRPRAGVALFLLKLLVFTALVSGFSKTYYLVHSERGIAPVVSALFGDIEIENGRLVCRRDMPYELPGAQVATLMDRFMGQQGFFGRVPDNFLVVDTRDPASGYGAGNEPRILLGPAAAEFREVRITIPYRKLVGDNFSFSLPAIQAFLNRNIIPFAFHLVAMSFTFGLFTLSISVFFLALAAFLFSVDRARGFRYFVRLASFSITPVMAGTALVSLSGVGAGWMWHVFIIMSTIIMFRAMALAAADKASEEKREVL